MLGEIAIALVVIVVVVALGFGGYLVYYHLSARRRGHTPGSVIPDHITNVFSRNRPTSGGGGSGGAFASDGAFGVRGGGGGAGGTGRSRQKFAALDVDEAWDSHVDEEMADYDNVRLADRSGGGGNAKTAYYDELDDVDDSTHLAAGPSSSRGGRAHSAGGGIDAKGRLSNDELNERYDSVMETGSSVPSDNPFGSGAYRNDGARR